MRTTTPYALNGHARVRLNCVVVAGGVSYLFHYFICLYFCRMRTWIFLRMPTALCACLVQPTLSATCSHSLVMVAPRSGAFGRRRGNKSCGFIGNIASCVAMRGYFWRNIETCALKMFECERLFVNSTALNLSHVAFLVMTISFLKCAFFRTLNFLMYIACSLNSILNAKMHGPCREHNLQRNFTGPVTAPSVNQRFKQIRFLA